MRPNIPRIIVIIQRKWMLPYPLFNPHTDVRKNIRSITKKIKWFRKTYLNAIYDIARIEIWHQ